MYTDHSRNRIIKFHLTRVTVWLGQNGAHETKIFVIFCEPECDYTPIIGFIILLAD